MRKNTIWSECKIQYLVEIFHGTNQFAVQKYFEYSILVLWKSKLHNSKTIKTGFICSDCFKNKATTGILTQFCDNSQESQQTTKVKKKLAFETQMAEKEWNEWSIFKAKQNPECKCMFKNRNWSYFSCCCEICSSIPSSLFHLFWWPEKNLLSPTQKKRITCRLFMTLHNIDRRQNAPFHFQ